MITDQEPKLYYAGGVLQSIEPAQYMFGYTYHSSMVPPFEPGNILILGYGKGTIASLIRNIWGRTPMIMGVDIEGPETKHCDAVTEFYEGNAFQFVKEELGVYDYVVVDLWNGAEPSSIVYDKEFIKNLAKITGQLLSVNVRVQDMDKIKESAYCDHFSFDFGKTIGGNAVVFFRRKE